MMRPLPLLLVIAVCSATVAIGASRAASGTAHRSYSSTRVLRAFTTQGFTLRNQHVRTSAHWTRFATRGSLRVIVFRRQRDATRTIEVLLGGRSHDRKAHPDYIVIHFRPSRGSGEPHIQQISFANIAVVYLRSPGLGPRVGAALDSLRHS